MTDSVPPGSPPDEEADDRLDSWKEIARYLRRDVTTVQRWVEMPMDGHVLARLPAPGIAS